MNYPATGRSSRCACWVKASSSFATGKVATACSRARVLTAGPTWRSDVWSRRGCVAPSTAGCSTSPANAWRLRRSRRRAACVSISGSRPIRSWRGAGSCSPIWEAASRRHSLISTALARPPRTSFLHRFFHDEEPEQGYGKLFRDRSIDSDMPMTRIMREFPRPRIEVEPTEFGLRIATLRRISDAHTHVRVTNLVFPHAFVIPMSSEMTITQWHVPIDDTRHYWYAIFTSFGAPVNKDEMRRQRLELYELPDYIPRKNKSNDYGFDPHEQEQDTFTGMGTDINVHDQWACESMGAIQDRSKEHLGQSDKAISACRRILRGAIDEAGRGGKPLMVLDPAAAAKITGPAAIDGIGPSEGWQVYWQRTDAARRKASSWANQRSDVRDRKSGRPF